MLGSRMLMNLERCATALARSVGSEASPCLMMRLTVSKRTQCSALLRLTDLVTSVLLRMCVSTSVRRVRNASVGGMGSTWSSRRMRTWSGGGREAKPQEHYRTDVTATCALCPPHLEPRARRPVVNVVFRDLALDGEAREPHEEEARRALVRRGVALREPQQQRDDREDDAEVLVLQQRDEALGVGLRGEEVARDAREAQEAQRGLLAHDGEDGARVEDALHVGGDGLGELLAADVGDGAEREALDGVLRALQVVADGLDDEGH